jgi:heptaprenyl diphosphate synthase
VAFQISDDILDITSSSIQSGKTPGTDLREGIATLPVLYALRSTDTEGARLRQLVSAPVTDDAEHAEALGLLRDSAALGSARATVESYAATAREMLRALPDVAAREALEALTHTVLDRAS